MRVRAQSSTWITHRPVHGHTLGILRAAPLGDCGGTSRALHPHHPAMQPLGHSKASFNALPN